MTHASREIYPGAPLQFVACEVRFPYTPALEASGALPILHRSLRSWLPLVEPVLETTIVVGPSAPISPPTSSRQLRFVSRDRRLAVLVTASNVTIETTSYRQYEDFREIIRQALAVASEVDDGPAGLTRIGLRYIDEVRVDRPVQTASDWEGFIDPRLLAPASLTTAGAKLGLLQGTVQFDLGAGRQVVMRYGALRGHSVGDAPLRPRRPLQDGPYFLIDIDSYWMAGEPLPEFSVDSALRYCDELHGPVRELFESSVTEQLRNEVLRRPANDG